MAVQSAEACSCGSIPGQTLRQRVRASLEGAHAVFLAEYVAAYEGIARLKVSKVWKGQIGTEVRVRQHIVDPSGILITNTCLPRLMAPGTFLVFASRDADDEKVLRASACSFTGRMDLPGKAEIMKLLDEFVRGG
jgi:hypothetical protein